MSLKNWICEHPGCTFSSSTQKGCHVHQTKIHGPKCSQRMYSPSFRVSSDEFCRGNSLPSFPDFYRLLCPQPMKKAEDLQRFATENLRTCSSSVKVQSPDVNEPDSRVSQSTSSEPTCGGPSNTHVSRERLNRSEFSVGVSTCSPTNPMPVSGGFGGPLFLDRTSFGSPSCPISTPDSLYNRLNIDNVSTLTPPFDPFPIKGSPLGGGPATQAPPDLQCAGQIHQATVESQTQIKRVVRTKRRSSKIEYATHFKDSESVSSTNVGLQCSSEILHVPKNPFWKTWPTCVWELVKRQDHQVSQECADAGNKSTLKFLHWLGECDVLDYEPCCEWDIVARCSVCREPLCGKRNMELHIMEHLEQGRPACACKLTQKIDASQQTACGWDHDISEPCPRAEYDPSVGSTMPPSKRRRAQSV